MDVIARSLGATIRRGEMEEMCEKFKRILNTKIDFSRHYHVENFL